MSVVEEKAPTRIFGEIKSEQMASNPDLARSVMTIVRDACAKRVRGGLSVEQVALGLRDGKYRLWGVLQRKEAKLEAVAVTEARDKTLEFHLIGPRFDQMAEFLHRFDAVAKAAGCDRLAITAPPSFGVHLRGADWFSREVRFEHRVGADQT